MQTPRYPERVCKAVSSEDLNMLIQARVYAARQAYTIATVQAGQDCTPNNPEPKERKP